MSAVSEPSGTAMRRALRRARDGAALDVTEAAVLLTARGADLEELLARAGAVRDKGLVVFTACSHAGVVNVLMHARESFPSIPVYAVAGGLHLSAANEKVIPETVHDLASFNLNVIAPGHCTGWRATHALVDRFGEDVVTPSAVGKAYTL